MEYSLLFLYSIYTYMWVALNKEIKHFLYPVIAPIIKTIYSGSMVNTLRKCSPTTSIVKNTSLDRKTEKKQITITVFCFFSTTMYE